MSNRNELSLDFAFSRASSRKSLSSCNWSTSHTIWLKAKPETYLTISASKKYFCVCSRVHSRSSYHLLSKKIPHHTKRNSNVNLWRYNTKFDCPRCIVVFKCMIPQSETTAETRSREVSLKNGKVSDKKKCVSLVLFETSVGWKQSYNQIHSPSIWLWTWSFKSTSSETGRLWWRINPRNSSTSWHVACLGIAFWNHSKALADFCKKHYTSNVNAFH